MKKIRNSRLSNTAGAKRLSAGAQAASLHALDANADGKLDRGIAIRAPVFAPGEAIVASVCKAALRTVLLWVHVGIGPMLGCGPMEALCAQRRGGFQPIKERVPAAAEATPTIASTSMG
jgi:hypothetical protein